MKLRTEDHGAWRDAMGRRHTAWTAIDDDTYDGAEDSRSPMGMGATEADAIADLMEQLDELEAAESAGRV